VISNALVMITGPQTTLTSSIRECSVPSSSYFTKLSPPRQIQLWISSS